MTSPPDEAPAPAPHVPTPEETAAAEAAEKQRAAEALSKAQALVTKRANDLLPAIQQARELAKKIRAAAAEVEAAAGNLEGSLITARDISRHDPARAGLKLKEAATTFNDAAAKFPALK